VDPFAEIFRSVGLSDAAAARIALQMQSTRNLARVIELMHRQGTAPGAY
jgi:hypothetical protein